MEMTGERQDLQYIFSANKETEMEKKRYKKMYTFLDIVQC